MRITSPGADKDLGQYIRTLQVSKEHAIIDIQIPNKYKADVTLYIPRSENLQSSFNLGSGSMRLDTNEIAGSRHINIGSGTLTLTTAHGRGYSSLRINIGSGILVDRRRDGKSDFGLVNRTETGDGKGTVLVNIGSGRLIVDGE